MPHPHLHTPSSTPPTHHGFTKLNPVELTSAGVLAGLTVTLGLGANALPMFEIFFRIAAVLPIALISTRMRWNVTFTACVACLTVGTAIGGLPTALSIIQSCLVAWILGAVIRRKISRTGTALIGALTGIVGAAATAVLLTILHNSRQLAIDSLTASLRGHIRILTYIPGTSNWKAPLERALDTAGVYWWILFPGLVFVGVFITFIIAAAVLRKVVQRLKIREVEDRFYATTGTDTAHISPLPLRVEEVSYRYPGSGVDAVDNVSFHVNAGDFVIITGHNGSGKSTLASILAGVSPTQGRIVTPGNLGRGHKGGLAYLSQSAASHVVGSTVREDVAWGFSPQSVSELSALNKRIDEVLARVGLLDLAHAQTRHLSGGELQRLALASALIHEPALIVSDETTAMVDPAGRIQMMQILRDLAAQGLGVIHITHAQDEFSFASRIIRLDSGRLVFDGSPENAPPLLNTEDFVETVPLEGHVQPFSDSEASKRRLWLRQVTHYVAFKTPWQRRILDTASLIVEPGECVLITGSNGSGKTTLARLLTGLITPSYGSVTLGDRDMWSRVGDVSLNHQFSRLQLMRPTVGEDILDAIGFRGASSSREHDDMGFPVFSDEESARIEAALGVVGLGAELMRRGIDELSGGQQRRVALAGLIAAEPAALILDEPFAGLDAQSRQILIATLHRVQAGGTSLILISHDDDGLHALAQRHFHLENGRFVGQEPQRLSVRQNRLRKTAFTVPSPLPWDSFVSRTWAGTKIGAWSAVSTFLLFDPSWWNVGISAVFLLVLSVLAQAPLSAVPRFPIPVWAGFVGGIIGAAIGGDLLVFLRAMALMVVMLWGTLLLLWTTHTWQFTSALASFMRPFGRVGLPVHSWVHAMSLAVRSVPLLVDHMTALNDTMTIRLYRNADMSNKRIFGDLVDLVTAALSEATHHAALIGVAMSMRGGLSVPMRLPVQWRWCDSVVLFLAAVTCSAMGFFSFLN